MSAPSGDSANPELRKLIRKRTSIRSSITTINSFVSKFSPSTQSIRQIQTRLSKLNELISTFSQTQESILELDLGYEEENERLSFEDECLTLRATMEDLIAKYPMSDPINSSHSSNTSTISDKIRLPAIQPPQFDGSLENWASFFDTFNALFHNNATLNDVQRLHYLKSSVTGSAADIIKNFSITADNYSAAYEELVRHYENKGLTIQTHIRFLLQSPKVSTPSAVELRKLHHHVTSHVRALKAHGQLVQSWDAWLVTLICGQLDPITVGEWQLKQDSKELPTYIQIETFLAKRVAAYEAGLVSNFTMPMRARAKNNNALFTSLHTNQPKCAACTEAHKLYSCTKFNTMSIAKRRELVLSAKLCFNCLNGGHQVKDCKFSSCRVCGKRHNSKLHEDNSNTDKSPNNVEVKSNNGSTVLYSEVSSGNESMCVMLATSVIMVYDKHGQPHNCRAVLDSGSQVNFITHHCAKRLNLELKVSVAEVTGIGSITASTNFSTNASIVSRFGNYRYDIPLQALPSIVSALPAQSVDLRSITIPAHIKNALADPQFQVPGPVDLLIGSKIFFKILGTEKLPLSRDATLLSTQFGWILTGELPISYSLKCSSTNTFLSGNAALSFFTSSKASQLKDEEKRAVEHFNQTVTRTTDGRFMVKLPFCKDPKSLGNSDCMAKRRFFNLEKRLVKDPVLAQHYQTFMNEYLQLGHMEPVVDFSVSPTYYLPHHPVFKDNSSTTKVRVVFDGSASASSGLCLNDILLKGPKVQADISKILWRFRIHSVAITADVEKMYRQILVAPEDRDFQRIWYRAKPDDALKEFRLKTVTYGTKSASFLSTQCILEVANSCADLSIKRIISQDFYVDDLISGSSSESECFGCYQQVQNTLVAAGFPLRKWCSSSPSLMKRIPNSQEDPNFMVDLIEADVISTLGLLWQPTTDCFRFSIKNWSIPARMTKRTLLSDINSIYDPIGLLCPVLIKGKIFIQQLWSFKMGWDDELSSDLQSRWSTFYTSLGSLKSLIVPRRVICSEVSSIQIHGFCDASQEAFGACIYLRSVDAAGCITIKLYTSRSRVAPMHPTTIPRLELSGALLLAELYTEVQAELKLLSITIEPTSVYLWSDSTIVLGWIYSQSLFQVFVSNRLARIRDVTVPAQWHHVSTLENPADLISRGISSSNIFHSMLWWEGPTWLSEDQNNWPSSRIPAVDSLPEIRNVKLVLHNVQVVNSIFDRFSNWTSLFRVTGWLLRFAHNARCHKGTFPLKLVGPLTVPEVEAAQTVWFRYAQLQFSEEFAALKKQRQVAGKSPIKSLNPFLDKDNVIRVNGRLARAPIANERKFPIILPRQHRLTRMIFEYEHVRLLHVGPQALLANIQLRFWPLHGRDIAKSVVRNCKVCFKFHPTFSIPLMAPLPKERVTIERPFNRTGVDFCGPILIKSGIRRVVSIKGYIAVFVCFVTRAVHLELVTDLTSDAFLAALSRFMSRRGMCSHLYSDNATNFVGAHKILKQYFTHNSKKQVITDIMANHGIQWHFIPPASPHFGGLWEAAVKSAKHHMLKITKGALFSAEEINTLLCRIEAVLNSRPLVPLSDDPGEFEALTPSHFLIGGHLMLPQEPDVTAVPKNKLRRFQLMRSQFQLFWARWSKEYLPQLHKRNRWTSSGQAVAVGELAVLKEDNVPPLQWKLVRITALHPGADGKTRVATIRLSSGAELKRPVVKLAVLPIPTEED